MSKIKEVSRKIQETHHLLAGKPLQVLLNMKDGEDIYQYLEVLKNSPNTLLTFFSGIENNSSIVTNSSSPCALGERITNAVDSLIQDYIEKGLAEGMNSPREVLDKNFQTPSDVENLPVQVSLQGKYSKSRRRHEELSHQVTLDIRDFGVGIPNDKMLSTILAVRGTTKTFDPRFTGAFGQGGSAPFGFSKVSMILTRTENSPTVSLAFVIKCSPSEVQELMGGPKPKRFAFLTVLDSTTKRPFEFSAYNRFGKEIFPKGTLIRHFDYMIGSDLIDPVFPETKKKTSSLFKTLTNLFPRLPIPILLKDERKGLPKHKEKSAVIVSALSSLEGNSKTVEYSNSANYYLGKGYIKFTWFVLNDEATKNNVMLDYSDSHTCGSVYLNGQRVDTIPTSLVRDSGFPYLERSLLIFVDLENHDTDFEMESLHSSRECLMKLFKEHHIFEPLTQNLKSDETLVQIHNKRRISPTQSSIDIKKVLGQYLKGFLGSGNFRHTKGQKTNVPQPIPPSRTPTIFEVVGSRKAVYAGQSLSIKIRTDIPNDYFQKGTFKVSTGNGSIVDTSSWSITSSEHERVQGHKNLVGLTVKEEAELYQTDTLRLSVSTPSTLFTAEVALIVVEKPESKSSGNVPDVDIKWLDSSPENENTMARLGFLDHEGSVMTDKVGTLVRNKDGSSVMYLLRQNDEVVKALTKVKSDGRIKGAYEEYEDFFLNRYFNLKVTLVALGYVYKDGLDAGSVSSPEEPDTPFEVLLRNVSKAECSFWENHYQSLVKIFRT